MGIIKDSSKFYRQSKFRTFMVEDERQLDIILESPDKSLVFEDDRGYSMEKKLFRDNVRGSIEDTLRARLKNFKEQNVEILQVSYDFFFGGSTRLLFPDSEKTVAAYKVIHDLAKEYGLKFSASITNPLDLGGGYVKNHEEVGYSWHYHEGEIDSSGHYSVKMTKQTQWSNNKGPIRLVLDRIVVYAFHEERLSDTNYFYVNPDEIIDISSSAKLEIVGSEEISKRGNGSVVVRIIGDWKGVKPGYNRCLTVLVYRTQELDYFADGALDYMKGIIDLHADAGITYQGFYSDEMHIQFDWDSNVHFALNEVTTRYLTPGFMKRYAALYGEQFNDFGKYLIYFSYHQHDFCAAEKDMPVQHIFMPGSEGVYKTWLFRKRYFELLQDVVVGLCVEVKKYTENKFKNPVDARGHATWKESPTLDKNYPEMKWYSLRRDDLFSRYDYHPEYVFSSSIIEAVAACYDYFRWNDYFTGGGTDHGEHGYSDRNYYTQAFGASLGVLNAEKTGYAGGWGSPRPIIERLNAVGRAYGNGGFRGFSGDTFVQNMENRLTDVLAIYPLDLLYTEERFGSWMVQYGYCNYITEQKLLEYASVDSTGMLMVNGRSYRALVFLYQSFINGKTLKLINDFLANGGRVIWMATPPVLCWDNDGPADIWCDLFGVKPGSELFRGIPAKNSKIRFDAVVNTADMVIPTEMLPDFIYDVTANDAKEIAWLGDRAVGFEKIYAGGGRSVYLAFRARDDQSQSMGSDISTLFDLLCYIGAYSKDGAEIISRPEKAKYLINRFPNGAVSIAAHYRTFKECWPGLFGRDPKQDEEYLLGRELPSMEITLSNERLFGNLVNYRGSGTLSYRVEDGRLCGFSGNSGYIAINGKEYSFAAPGADVCFTNVDAKHHNAKAAILVYYGNAGRVTIPNTLGLIAPKAAVCVLNQMEPEREIAVDITDESISVVFDVSAAGRWILVWED